MKLTFNEILVRYEILTNIPYHVNERNLSVGTTTSLLLMKIAYQNKVEEYENICRKALEDIKKDDAFSGFDDMARDMAEAEDVLSMKKKYDEWYGKGERPECPSKEAIEKAESVMQKKEAYQNMLSNLTERYNTVRVKQALAETSIEVVKLTREEIEDIVGVIGTTGKVKINTQNGEFEESSVDFLSVVAKCFA